MTQEREARIRRHAHHLWVSEGHPEGRHEDHWLRAEAAIAAEDATTTHSDTTPPEAAGSAARTARTKTPAEPKKPARARKAPDDTGAEAATASPKPRRRKPATGKTAEQQPDQT